ncbi:MAG: hypothetical protein ABIK33_01295 [candidate division WOR-3 bacterium]
MLKIDQRRKLIPVRKYSIPFRWILIGAGIVIFLAIYILIKQIFL